VTRQQEAFGKINHEEKDRTNDAGQQQRYEYPHRVELAPGRLPVRGKVALAARSKAESAGYAFP
jgi:hypothetical protein